MKTRNIREVKVGDIVTDADKKKHWVIDVLKNTFIANDGYGKAEIIMFDIAELEEWQVEGGVDDSEEFTEKEIYDLEIYALSQVEKLAGTSGTENKKKFYLEIAYKLNKMLKEKE